MNTAIIVVVVLVVVATAVVVPVVLVTGRNDDDDSEDSTSSGTGLGTGGTLGGTGSPPSQNPSSAPTLGPSFSPFEVEDPFLGANDVTRWNDAGAGSVNNNGLTLEILNALSGDDTWTPFLELVVGEWDNGSPDALTLSISRVAPDPACGSVVAKIKVCNDDYGATQWRSITQVLISNSNILAATIKLNEYYFVGASDALRQYSLCHELGHAFGLPHTDENFYNADLGNCMDYTVNPEANASPDTSLFSALAAVYGEVRRTILRRGLEEEPTAELATDGKDLGSVLRTAESVLGRVQSEDWRHVKRFYGHNYEGYEVELGDGYRLQVHTSLQAET